MHGTDAGAGQHGHRGFGDHGHINGDDVALTDAAGFESVGQAADLSVQLAVTDVGAFLRIVPLPDDGGLLCTCFEMTIQTVCGDVELAVFVPAYGDRTLVEAGVFDFAVRAYPVQALALFSPEALRVLDRLGIKRFIAIGIRPGALGKIIRNRVCCIRGHGSRSVNRVAAL